MGDNDCALRNWLDLALVAGMIREEDIARVCMETGMGHLQARRHLESRAAVKENDQRRRRASMRAAIEGKEPRP